MVKQGWVAIYRQLQDHWLWEDKPFSKQAAWIDMLLLANHDDNKFLLGNELVEVKCGSFISSIEKLKARWGWSNTKVINFLKLLENDGMVIKKSDTKKTVITIVKYGDYAVYEKTKTMPKRCENDTETMREHTNNNDNNENNDNNYLYIKDIYNEICVSLPKLTVLSDRRKQAIKARLNKYSVDQIKEAFVKAEASDFLKGNNKSDWTANFDWLMKDANIAKVLDGNYDNKTSYSGGASYTKGNESRKTSYSLALFEDILNQKITERSEG
jgi:hypothetical protein